MQDLPDFLTVEEAAAILRIGRTAAYEQTRRYEEVTIGSHDPTAAQPVAARRSRTTTSS